VLLRSWYLGFGWAVVLSSSKDMVLSMPQNFVIIQIIRYDFKNKVSNTYVCSTYDLKNTVRRQGWMTTDICWWTSLWTNVRGWKGPGGIVTVVWRNDDKCRMERWWTSDGTTMIVRRNNNYRWTELWMLLDEMATVIKWNDKGCWTKQQWLLNETTIVVKWNDNSCQTELSNGIATIVEWNCIETKRRLRQNKMDLGMEQNATMTNSDATIDNAADGVTTNTSLQTHTKDCLKPLQRWWVAIQWTCIVTCSAITCDVSNCLEVLQQWWAATQQT